MGCGVGGALGGVWGVEWEGHWEGVGGEWEECGVGCKREVRE